MSRQLVEVGFLKLEHSLVIGHTGLEHLTGLLLVKCVSSRAEQSSASGDPGSNVVWGDGNAFVHLVHSPIPQFGSPSHIAFLKSEAGFEKESRAVPYHGLSVLWVFSQRLFTSLDCSIKCGLITGKPRKEVFANKVIKPIYGRALRA